MSGTKAVPHGSPSMSIDKQDPLISRSTPNEPQQNESLSGSDFPPAFPSEFSAQAPRIFEARVADASQHIQDTSHPRRTLLDRKKETIDYQQDIDRHHSDDIGSPELQQKLTNLEQQWSQIGQETARPFIPRNRYMSDNNDVINTPISVGGDVGYTPANLSRSTMSRRNISADRVHDIELATEISTSLLTQVRNLQAMIAEKEDTLRKVHNDNLRLQSNSDVLQARLRSLDHDEERFKDENWNLETQVQDLAAQIREFLNREEKLKQTLDATKAEKVSAQHEFEDIKQSHDRLIDDHAALQKHHDTELNGLRHAVSSHETTHLVMQKKIDELSSQNQELAHAVSYRIQSENAGGVKGIHTENLSETDQVTPENSPPPSPTKATPRHGGLEQETLKSSLTHAHRMIQNLKNNIHREKTEKLELKRMLQDTRDELEARQNNSGSVAISARRSKQANDFKKPTHLAKLGGRKETSEEIWEEYEHSPTRPALGNSGSGRQSQGSEETSDVYATATENSDAYATASDKETATETDAFATAESVAGADSDDLTETEDGPSRPRNAVSSIESRPHTATRTSFLSSASDEENARIDMTPPSIQQRYKLRLTRGGDRASESPSVRDSPASFLSNNSQRVSTINLATELGGFEDDESIGTNTPSRSLASRQVSPEWTRSSASRQTTPNIPSQSFMVVPALDSKLEMKETGTMTEPGWYQRDDRISTATSVSTEVVSDGVLDNVAGGMFGDSVKVSAGTAKLAEFTDDEKMTRKSFESRVTHATMQPNKYGSDVETHSQPLGLSSIEVQQIIPLTSIVPNDTGFSARAKLSPGPSANESRQRNTGSDTKIREPFTTSMEGRDIKQRKQKATDHTSRTRAAGSSGPAILEDRYDISKASIENNESKEPALRLRESSQDIVGQNRIPLRQVSGNTTDRRHQGTEKVTRAQLTAGNISTNDEGSQTSLSAEQIDRMMIDRAHIPGLIGSSPTGPPWSGGARSSSSGRPSAIDASLALRSSGSTSSLRKDDSVLPPLPQHAKETIAAASRPNSSHRMAPTTVPSPASIRQLQQPLRPRTPSLTNRSISNSQSPLKVATTHSRTPVTAQNGSGDQHRRDSVSSFASELDERFNPSTQAHAQAYDVPGTDPRMIAAITQTMIGEFLWKYTRKPGRGELSENRHRRFFWIHPYTRTLYWSTQDPGAAGRAELKAKSVPIDAVRVISDESIVPPGLHSKSIVVVTPGRNIKFTAPTNYRHETWFNALSYLLLRGSGDQRQEVHQAPNTVLRHERTATVGSIESADLEGFEPSQRTSSRLTTHSHRSTNSASKSTRISNAPNFSYRAPSPQGPRPAYGYYAHSAQAQTVAIPTSGSIHASAMQGQRVGNPTAVISDSQIDKREHFHDLGEFKKPALPQASVQSQSFQSVARKSTPSKPMNGSPIKSSSFASRISSSLTSKSRRGRQDSRALDEERRKEAVMEEEIEQSANQQHRHISGSISQQHTPRKVENVRACCDGKHDVGHLHHRSNSRAASIASVGRRSLSLMGSRTHLGESEH